MAATGLTVGHLSAPRSVEQITKQAHDFDFDANVPLKHWLHTANTLINQVWPARVYVFDVTYTTRQKDIVQKKTMKQPTFCSTDMPFWF